MPGKATRCAALAVLASTSGIGCVPVRAWQVPAVTGHIHRGSTSVSGATVTWRNLSPSDPKITTGFRADTTNQSGAFVIKGERKWTTGMLLPADALVSWRIELEAGGQSSVLWQQSLVTPGVRSTPGRIALDCDLAEADPCVLLDTDHSRLLPLGRRLSRQ
jgi:hypothetical protein